MLAGSGTYKYTDLSDIVLYVAESGNYLLAGILDSPDTKCKSRIVSVVIEPRWPGYMHEKTLTLWYYMYGKDADKLNLYTRERNQVPYINIAREHSLPELTYIVPAIKVTQAKKPLWYLL